MVKVNNLVHFVFLTFILNGSLWHLSSIVELYFSYPTNILIETDFQTDERVMPALTFCANIWNQTRNRTTEQTFKDIIPDKIIANIYTVLLRHQDQDLKQYTLGHTLESLSLRYYCFLLNNVLKGKKN